MTKFTYEEKKEPKREQVAALHLFDDGPKLCLVIKTSNPDEFLWMYEDGGCSVQSMGLSGGRGEEPVKKFYRGDSITITF